MEENRRNSKELRNHSGPMMMMPNTGNPYLLFEHSSPHSATPAPLALGGFSSSGERSSGISFEEESDDVKSDAGSGRSSDEEEEQRCVVDELMNEGGAARGKMEILANLVGVEGGANDPAAVLSEVVRVLKHLNGIANGDQRMN